MMHRRWPPRSRSATRLPCRGPAVGRRGVRPRRRATSSVSSVEKPSTTITSCKRLGRFAETCGRFFASLRVGMTTLTRGHAVTRSARRVRKRRSLPTMTELSRAWARELQSQPCLEPFGCGPPAERDLGGRRAPDSPNPDRNTAAHVSLLLLVASIQPSLSIRSKAPRRLPVPTFESSLASRIDQATQPGNTEPTTFPARRSAMT